MKKLLLSVCITGLGLAGCHPSLEVAKLPPPVVVNECTLEEPFEKPKLPIVAYIKENEAGCPYYYCLTKEEAYNASKREATLRAYANSMLELYLDAKERCDGN